MVKCVPHFKHFRSAFKAPLKTTDFRAEELPANGPLHRFSMYNSKELETNFSFLNDEKKNKCRRVFIQGTSR